MSPKRAVEIRTWMVEASVVAVLLVTVSELTGGTLPNRIAAIALLFSFMHGQVSDRLAEGQAASKNPIKCHRRANQYWVTKEILWITVFILSDLWAAVAGSFVFLAYPFWRRWYRHHQEKQNARIHTQS